MYKFGIALAVIALLFIGIGCSGASSPTTPDKSNQSMENFFNSFDLSGKAVATYSYTDSDGKLVTSGTLGRDKDGSLYSIESRGAQFDVPLAFLHLVNCWIVYNNPAGTMPSGPNAGLPYYYLGQTVDYDIDVLSMMSKPIGGFHPPFGYWGNATLTAEMHYAEWDPADMGAIIVGDPLPGAYQFVWEGIINPGYMMPPLNDTFHIENNTLPGLDVTTCRITAPIFFGIFDIIFFDGVAGIWDPQ
jgi:hypothetical protein